MKKIIFLMVCLLGFSGCYKSEWESAKAENEHAKAQITQLQAQVSELTDEVKKFQETAQYHYQQGQEHFSTGRYADAITSFNTVVSRFPTDPLVAQAQRAVHSAQQMQATEIAKKRREEAAAQEAAAEEIRNRFAKIRKARKSWLDSECEGKGYPGYGFWFEGDTFEQHAELARTLGCRYDGPSGINAVTAFCCPM